MRTVNLQKGFSLVELAVVLGIVGIVAIGSVGVFSEQRTHAKWQEGGAKLDLVKRALLQHAHFNKFLPCPDANGNGFEDRNGNLCTQDSGGVPFRNIDLSEADVEDSWGNRFHYAINQNADTAALNNCPLDSACFFNNASPPHFDLSTWPVMGNPGFGNLRVCNAHPCGATDIVGDDFIAVLVSYNENGGTIPVAASAEAENRGNNGFFVQAPYSENPYFDDLVQTISANELKKRFETEVITLERTSPPNVTQNPVGGGNVPIAGGDGDNWRFSQNIGMNVVTTTAAFGAQYAGETVTLTFDAEIRGEWEDAGFNGGTPDTYTDGTLETQDRFLVGLNGGDVSDLDGTTGNLVNSVKRFDNHEVVDSYFYDADLDIDNKWNEFASYNVELDSNGELKIDFAVFSTHVTEEVIISNLEVVLYQEPSDVPEFPVVLPIPGIPETGGLY